MSGQILFTNIFNPALTKALHANLTLLTKQQTDRDTLIVDINARAPPFHALHRSHMRLALTVTYWVLQAHAFVGQSLGQCLQHGGAQTSCVRTCMAHRSHVPRLRQLHTMRLLSACPRWQLRRTHVQEGRLACVQLACLLTTAQGHHAPGCLPAWGFHRVAEPCAVAPMRAADNVTELVPRPLPL